MRYTRASASPLQARDVPLLTGHIARLKGAHSQFTGLDSKRWGMWPGDDVVWETIRTKLDGADQGDWRIRVLLHPGAHVEVQVVPAPSGLGMFISHHFLTRLDAEVQTHSALNRNQPGLKRDDRLYSIQKTTTRHWKLLLTS